MTAGICSYPELRARRRLGEVLEMALMADWRDYTDRAVAREVRIRQEAKKHGRR